MNRNLPEHQAFTHIKKQSFIINQLIYVNEDGTHKKAVSVIIEFIAPKLLETDTLNLETQTPGSILFKEIETNKILKNLDIVYTKSETLRNDIIYWYKILNVVDEYDDNSLQILKLAQPVIINGISYSYNFILSVVDMNGISAGDRIYLGNTTEETL